MRVLKIFMTETIDKKSLNIPIMILFQFFFTVSLLNFCISLNKFNRIGIHIVVPLVIANYGWGENLLKYWGW